MTILGIRPDVIRLSEIIKKFDINFNHTLVHSGQHYDYNLSQSFFNELNVRTPDYNFAIGQESEDHLGQLAHLILKLKQNIDIIKKQDLVVFLGDSNSVLAAPLIKKMGVKVAHIEAGMRCYDEFMFEEINRIVCDHVSDLLFCYTSQYVNLLDREGVRNKAKIFNVGNTITEVVQKILPQESKLNSHIILDIHRQENFLNHERLSNIIKMANGLGQMYNLPVHMLKFNRTINKIHDYGIDLGKIKVIDLMGFTEYIRYAHHSKLVISDSGTAQEELAFLKTPVVVPRDTTERPLSELCGCSLMVDVNQEVTQNTLDDIVHKADNVLWFDTSWLGNGKTSDLIVQYIKGYFNI